MGILDNIAFRLGELQAANRQGYVNKASVDNAPAWLAATAGAERFNLPDLGRARNQADLYSRLTWVSIAISHVSEQSSGAKMSVKERAAEEIEDIPNHPFEELFLRPNPLNTRSELLSGTVAYYKLTGNAYWWMNRANENERPTELWLLPSYMVQPVPDEQMFIKGYTYDPGTGNKIPLEPWEVCHFKRFNPTNPYVGLSQISQLAILAEGDLAMQKHNTKYFREDGGRSPGFLAFADSIADADWETMKSEFRDAAAKRRLMMLRNVGKGGVEWVANSMTQAEMQFLEGRKANKEEVFDWLAPGLSSWLSVNSTEANSKSGRDAFYELSVWPIHQMLGEKITNEILPAYGEGLIGEFDDVRPIDRAARLTEQQAYERTHTIDEIRAEWYEDDDIGDERGNLLPVEVNAPSFGAALPVDEIDETSDEDMDEMDQMDDEEEDAEPMKVQERENFRKFAKKRLKEGKPDKVTEFEFKHVGITEQESLRAEFLGAEYTLKATVESLIETLREKESA